MACSTASRGSRRRRPRPGGRDRAHATHHPGPALDVRDVSHPAYPARRPGGPVRCPPRPPSPGPSDDAACLAAPTGGPGCAAPPRARPRVSGLRGTAPPPSSSLPPHGVSRPPSSLTPTGSRGRFRTRPTAATGGPVRRTVTHEADRAAAWWSGGGPARGVVGRIAGDPDVRRDSRRRAHRRRCPAGTSPPPAPGSTTAADRLARTTTPGWSGWFGDRRRRASWCAGRVEAQCAGRCRRTWTYRPAREDIEVPSPGSSSRGARDVLLGLVRTRPVTGPGTPPGRPSAVETRSRSAAPSGP